MLQEKAPQAGKAGGAAGKEGLKGAPGRMRWGRGRRRGGRREGMEKEEGGAEGISPQSGRAGLPGGQASGWRRGALRRRLALRGREESAMLEAEVSTVEFQYEKERIFACDEGGKVIAEITFPVSNGVADINHTFVDGSLRGQGVAAMLTEAAVTHIRALGLRLRSSCSYAQKWLLAHPEYDALREREDQSPQ